MNRNTNYLWISFWLVFIVVFNIIVFLIISSFTIAFWISYCFIHFAYLMLIVSTSSMPKVKNSIVLGFPMIYLSYLYFIGAFIIGVICMIHKDVGFKIAFIPQLIIAGIYAVSYIPSLIANESTSANERQSQEDILYIKDATMEINQLMSQVTDVLLKKKLEKLYDTIRSSQVKSHPTVSGIELNIMIKFEELKERVYSNDYTSVSLIIDSINKLISERNMKIATLLR